MAQSHFHQQWPESTESAIMFSSSELSLKWTRRFSSLHIQIQNFWIRPSLCWARVILFSFLGQFERADWEGWDCNHGDRVEHSSLPDQLRMRGQHRCGFPQRLAPLVHHSRAAHLRSVSVSLRAGLDVVGEGVGDVAHHGGLGDRHRLGVQSWEVGCEGTPQVSHRVDSDVSDGLSYVLVSRRDGRRCDWLRGGRGGTGRGGYVHQVFVVGRKRMTDWVDYWRVWNGSVSDDGWLDLNGWRLEGMLWRKRRAWRWTRGRGCGEDSRQRESGMLNGQMWSQEWLSL